MRLWRPLTATVLAIILFGLSTGTGDACVLDNLSSLAADGHAAVRNFASPSGNLDRWAPFYFERVYGMGQAIGFAEKTSDLKKNLSSAELAHPFRWSWGDGTQTIGTNASHVYHRTGMYLINVYAFDALQRGSPWFPFDRARVQIVPAGELWRDNLVYEVLDLIGFALTWGVRVLLAALALCIAYGFFWEDRRRKPKLNRITVK